MTKHGRWALLKNGLLFGYLLVNAAVVGIHLCCLKNSPMPFNGDGWTLGIGVGVVQGALVTMGEIKLAIWRWYRFLHTLAVVLVIVLLNLYWEICVGSAC